MNVQFWVQATKSPSCGAQIRTTFWTTLSFRGKTGSILSFDEVRGSSCQSQVVLSDSALKVVLSISSQLIQPSLVLDLLMMLAFHLTIKTSDLHLPIVSYR